MEKQLRDTLMGLSGNNTYQKNYLIEAGAGAGKTFIMVRRIANQLISGLCACENMAVITFTNKATEEMRERLDTLLREQRDAQSDPTKKQHLDQLIRAAGRMQVSTIHSFCKTMLESLPFESGLGMEMNFLENESSYCKAFFERQCRENRSQFAEFEKFGFNCHHLTAFFAELCAVSDGEFSHKDESSIEITNRKNDLVAQMKLLHQSLPPKLNACKEALELLDETVKELLSLSAQDFAADDENSFRLAALVATRKHPLKIFGSKDFLDSVQPPKDSGSQDGTTAQTSSTNTQLIAQWDEIQTEWDSAKASASNAAKELIHSRCMPIMLKLVDEYRQEKRKQHIVSSNDLLIFTRNMLRDKPEARRILHDRYKVLYVDEFQDTDPIQAQILFYLTTDEKDFNKDWTQCKPVPGSLFLVGDPKQAIYRFRGADIDVYKDVEKLFDSGIGQVEHLALNYRSTQEICQFSKSIFAPDQPSGTPSETAPVTSKLDGGFYQAAFADMTAKKGNCSRARILRYKPTPGKPDEKQANDAARIAAFIKKMVADKIKVGSDDHTVTYGDFLILPAKKDAVTDYAARLSAEGIPVNVTGKQMFNEIEPIRRLLIHLSSLVSPGSNFALGRVLVLCYGVKLPTIRRFLQQASECKKNLSLALIGDRIEALGAAFSAAGQPDDEILALCAILRELKQLRDMAQTAPAMSVIEKLMDGGYAIWENCSDITHRRREYAYVQQFLQLLRRSPERDLAALTALAEEYGEHDVEHELSLTANPNAVHIMNVHKSKGLEGEIVILPYSTVRSPSPTHHTRRTAAGEEHDYCMFTKSGRFTTVCGQPLHWNLDPTGGISSEDREKNYQKAEKIRLLYVAATRAKSMLLICDTGYWNPVNDAKKCSLIGKRLKDEQYGEQLKYLIPDTPLPASNTTSSAAPVTAGVDTCDIENNLETLARAHLSRAQYPITPSRLDHQSRTATRQKDRDDDVAVPDLQTDANDTNTPDTAAVFSPHGPDWGTIIHRIMELAVRAGKFDGKSIAAFSRQAVTETLPDGILSKAQKKMLFNDAENLPDNWVDELSSCAEQASAFLENANTPLRQLLDGAKCYTELPFILRETDRDSALYRHLSEHIKDSDAVGKDLDVQGVIDLAIWKNGEWTVVDYKTDRLGKDDKNKFKTRLRDAYTAQIASYAQVLERLGKGKVTHTYLCSIPLGGELIPLDPVDDVSSVSQTPESAGDSSDAPQASAPATATRISHAVAQLYSNKKFDKTVFSSLHALSNTFDFSLVLDGEPVALIDKNKERVTEIQKCRQFVVAIQRWLTQRYPEKDCSIDLLNAGNQTLLRRALKTMHRILPTDVWDKIEIRWTKIPPKSDR